MITIIRRMALCIILSGLYSEVWAGLPFFTDDPEPVEYQNWEVYLASIHTHDSEGWTGTVPHLEINYGPIPNVQLHLISPFAYNKLTNTSEHYGYGDTELGVKFRFVEETGNSPQIGVFPLAEIPTGSEKKGLGGGHTQVFLPLWIQKIWGPWTSYGGGGYWINPGEDNKNWTFLGWELQRDLTKNLMIGCEIFHRGADTREASDSRGFNVGGIFDFDKKHHLLFSAGQDIHGPKRFTAYLALQWTFS